MSRSHKNARMGQTGKLQDASPVKASEMVPHVDAGQVARAPNAGASEQDDAGLVAVAADTAGAIEPTAEGGSIASDGETSAEEVFRCEECHAAIEIGDSVCPVIDGGYLCEACAPTWERVLEMPVVFDLTEAEAKRDVAEHLAAGGTLDDPYTPETAMTEAAVDMLADAIGAMVIEENARESSPQSFEHALDASRYMVAGLDVGRSPSQTAMQYAPEMLRASEAIRLWSAFSSPIYAAESAAKAVMTACGDGEKPKLLPDEDLAKYVCGLKAAADFIRTGGSSAEGRVFWNHLALGGFHGWGVNSWDDLPFALRLGWATFGSVIVTYDAYKAADLARGIQPPAPPIHRVAIEDTTLEMVDGILDRFDDRR